MSRHRGMPSRRGISKGPIIAVLATVFLIAAVFGWFELRHAVEAGDREAAAACVEGVAVLNVTADPDIAPVLTQLADRYNATKPVVRDHCAKVLVTAQPSPVVAAGLTTGTWNEGTLGPEPALWIPQSSRWVQRVRVPGLVKGQPTPLATTPIVLAVPDPLRQALAGARVTWPDLVKLQQGSLDSIGLPAWGNLGLALPPTDATLAVAQAIAEHATGSVPLSDQASKSAAVTGPLGSLAALAPKVGDADPVPALAGQADPTTVTMHAVPSTAHQVAAEGHGKVVAYQPVGSTLVADYPATALTGTWVDETQNQVAGLFADFLTDPAQRAAFTAAGYQVPGPLPALPSRVALDQLNQVLVHPVQGVFATVLLDPAAAMAISDGGASRLTNVTAALRAQLDTMPPASALGLWLVGRSTEAKPYRILDETATLSDSQRTRLAGALKSVRAGATKSDAAFPALEAAYVAASNAYNPSLANTLLFVTAGPNDNSDVTGDQLVANVTATADPTKPVRVDVIVISDIDSAPLQSLAKSTGGNYTRISGSDSTDLGTAIGRALSP